MGSLKESLLFSPSLRKWSGTHTKGHLWGAALWGRKGAETELGHWSLGARCPVMALRLWALALLGLLGTGAVLWP